MLKTFIIAIVLALGSACVHEERVAGSLLEDTAKSSPSSAKYHRGNPAGSDIPDCKWQPSSTPPSGAGDPGDPGLGAGPPSPDERQSDMCFGIPPEKPCKKDFCRGGPIPAELQKCPVWPTEGDICDPIPDMNAMASCKKTESGCQQQLITQTVKSCQLCMIRSPELGAYKSCEVKEMMNVPEPEGKCEYIEGQDGFEYDTSECYDDPVAHDCRGECTGTVLSWENDCQPVGTPEIGQCWDP